ncbi:hypothetical protein DdX_05542 [Ditylenchus destructor]|uniref:Uncharacterized protein n=1 Tax=Ditylenchus destructor TaxID=166010 RepID=A0AAD4NCV1_9BILA|nr:hypothetical protein DdX_05542 [Ditylenchus destructor]
MGFIPHSFLLAAIASILFAKSTANEDKELYYTRDQYIAPSEVNPLPTLYNYESILRRLGQQEALQSVDSSYKTDNANFDTPEEPSTERQRAKRRLVVRVPFAQNPDTIRLSRIYRQLFTHKQKKLNIPFAEYSLRNLLE